MKVHVFYLPVDRGFCFKPFIVLPKVSKRWLQPARQASLAHELIHYEQQPLFPVFWVIRYFLSKRFRFAQELPAFKKQLEIETMSASPARKLAFTRYIAKVMSEQYWGMCSFDEALKALEE
jgi:hypothetical protein